MTFTEELWRSITPTYDAILAHPFLTGLADGTLHPDAFTYYLCQDALYLGRYARALATLAGRAHEVGEVAMFARHAAGAVDVERHLHGSLLPQLGVDPPRSGPPSGPVPATTSARRAVTSGCSGTWATGRNGGPRSPPDGDRDGQRPDPARGRRTAGVRGIRGGAALARRGWLRRVTGILGQQGEDHHTDGLP